MNCAVKTSATTPKPSVWAPFRARRRLPHRHAEVGQDPRRGGAAPHPRRPQAPPRRAHGRRSRGTAAHRQGGMWPHLGPDVPQGVASRAERYWVSTGSVARPTALRWCDDGDAVPMLLSLPVIVDPAVPDYSRVVVDQRAIVSAVGQVKVATSEHQYFSSDSVLLRATWRFGHIVVRPNRLGVFTVSGGS